MFVDTAGVLEAVMATSTAVALPTATHGGKGQTHAPTAGTTVEYLDHSEAGTRTLYVVFVIMFISSLIFYIMAWRQPPAKRLFHVLTAFITTFATLSYFAMAVGQGKSYTVETHKTYSDNGSHATYTETHRELYWARYVDWSITTPLLLLDLAVLAGLNGADITVAVVADVIMVLTGLFAAVSGDRATAWGWYIMACVAYLVIVYLLGVNGRSVVQTKDSKTASFFTSIATYTLVLWTAYPVVWALAEGVGMLTPDLEILAYAVLDVLAKPGFGFWLLVTHDSVSSSSLSVGGFWSHGLATEGGIRVGDDEDGA